MVHTESCGIGHSAPETARAESASLARKGDDAIVPAVLAPDAQETMGQDATAEVRLELIAHEGRQLAAFRLNLGEKLQPVSLQGPVEQRRLRLPALVGAQASCSLVGA
jgi:hypothetical protein